MLPVYHQERTVTNYLRQTGLPQMTAFTTCFWFQLNKASSKIDDYLFSVAIPGKLIRIFNSFLLDFKKR